MRAHQRVERDFVEESSGKEANEHGEEEEDDKPIQTLVAKRYHLMPIYIKCVYNVVLKKWKTYYSLYDEKKEAVTLGKSVQ